MKNSSLLTLKKISAYLRKESKRKYVSLDMVSKNVGVYVEVLANELAFINPCLLMDPNVNIKSLLPSIEEAIEKEEAKKKASGSMPKAEPVSKKELASYSSISDFAYKKLTNAGGLVDSTISLSDHDLRVLKKLVEREDGERRRIKRLNKKK